MAPDAEPTTIRTARGEYRLRRTYGPAFPRPHFVELIGPEGALVCEYRCFTEADARRVAARLDLDAREGRVE